MREVEGNPRESVGGGFMPRTGSHADLYGCGHKRQRSNFSGRFHRVIALGSDHGRVHQVIALGSDHREQGDRLQ